MNHLNFDDAVAIYTSTAGLPGVVQQPNTALSERINGVWYLRNANGLIARVGCRSQKVF